ncbi:DUF805 domain-containing protein [Enterococcus faecalis]|uniref:DUF805 domain-containing protein n=1 Tax=Enterococcus faecalis TaxID=1351 RepID=UPI00102703E3|nr:DUF805 domain-containing protein [Enterococcus faecalis]
MVKIEEKGKVTFGQAFKDYFRGYVDFKGRTTRAGYWWMTLVLSILALIFYIAIVGKAVSAILAAEYFETYDFGNLLPLMLFALVLWLALLLPTWAMCVRRYRDAGMTGWGVLVLYLLSIACSYTQVFSVMSTFKYDVQTDTVITGGSPVFLFFTLVISLFFFLLTVLPTDKLTTTSQNSVLLHFFRYKEVK